MNTGIFSFTKLVVDNIQPVENFYREVFGMLHLRSHRENEHDYAQEEVMLATTRELGAPVLIIARYLNRPCPVAGSAFTGFTVSNLDKTLQLTTSHGGKIVVDKHTNTEHGVIAAILEDPAGHLIEAVQMLETRP